MRDDTCGADVILTSGQTHLYLAIGPARLGTARRMSGRHGTRASCAGPNRAPGLANGPGTACRAIFRAGPA